MRDTFTSPRIEQMRFKRRKRRNILMVVILSNLTISIIGLSYLSSLPAVTIDNIIVSGNHIINDSSIDYFVRNKLNGKYLFIFNKSNSFIYPHEDIYNGLIDNFPRIEFLSLKRTDLKTLHVEIKERSGSYLYCGEIIPEIKNEVGENCYFVNRDGYIFDKAPYFSGNVYFKFYTQINGPGGKNNLIKSYISDVDYFHRLMKFVSQINSSGFRPIYMNINKEDGNTTLYIYNSNDGGKYPKIIFKNDADFNLIFENLQTAMKKKEFSNDIMLNINKLNYIDLRFKDKVLYKFY
jgi:hypothetical protein